MKIVQQAQLAVMPQTVTSANLVNTKGYLKFNPALFSNITAIYFGAEGSVDYNDYDLEIQLYDVTNEEVITTLATNATTRTLLKSTDLKTVLGSEVELLVRVKMEDGHSFTNGYFAGAFLTILQDTPAGSSKTKMHIDFPQDRYTTINSTFQGNANQRSKPFTNLFDGTVKAYIEGFIWTTSGGTAIAKLYDETVGQDVSGGLISTKATTPTFSKSGELTLDPDHEYSIKYRNLTYGKTTYMSPIHLVIEATGFNKCGCVPVDFGFPGEANIANWHTSGQRETLASALEAVSKSSQWYSYQSIDWDLETDECNIRLLNVDETDIIVGSEYTIEYQEGEGHPKITLNITLPESDFIIAQQLDYLYSYGFQQGRIIVSLEGDPTPDNYIPADPTMPSGYHCFMSQYFKNVNAGFIPRKTPDGVNPLW